MDERTYGLAPETLERVDEYAARLDVTREQAVNMLVSTALWHHEQRGGPVAL